MSIIERSSLLIDVQILYNIKYTSKYTIYYINANLAFIINTALFIFSNFKYLSYYVVNWKLLGKFSQFHDNMWQFKYTYNNYINKLEDFIVVYTSTIGTLSYQLLKIIIYFERISWISVLKR